MLLPLTFKGCKLKTLFLHNCTGKPIKHTDLNFLTILQFFFQSGSKLHGNRVSVSQEVCLLFSLNGSAWWRSISFCPANQVCDFLSYWKLCIGARSTVANSIAAIPVPKSHKPLQISITVDH